MGYESVLHGQQSSCYLFKFVWYYQYTGFSTKGRVCVPVCVCVCACVCVCVCECVVCVCVCVCVVCVCVCVCVFVCVWVHVLCVGKRVARKDIRSLSFALSLSLSLSLSLFLFFLSFIPSDLVFWFDFVSFVFVFVFVCLFVCWFVCLCESFTVCQQEKRRGKHLGPLFKNFQTGVDNSRKGFTMRPSLREIDVFLRALLLARVYYLHGNKTENRKEKI